MSKGAWQRTGAFVGTVAVGTAIAKTVRPSRGSAVIDAAGNVFRNSLYAAMGGETLRPGRDNTELAEYQRGGDGSIGYWQPDIKSGVSVWKSAPASVEPTPDIVIPKLFPLPRTVPPKQVPYFWSGIHYRLLSLFPHVATPYTVNWASIAERLSGVDVGEDYELVAEVIAELWDRNGI